MWSLDLPSFIIGFIIAAILGSILRRIQSADYRRHQPYRQMDVKTRDTPYQVFLAATQAFWELVWWCISLIVFLGLAVSLVYFLMNIEHLFYS